MPNKYEREIEEILRNLERTEGAEIRRAITPQIGFAHAYAQTVF